MRLNTDIAGDEEVKKGMDVWKQSRKTPGPEGTVFLNGIPRTLETPKKRRFPDQTLKKKAKRLAGW